MTLEVHTLRYGNPDWIELFAPAQEEWCLKHGLQLRVWGDEFPQYPCPKFAEIEMLKAFLAGKSTHFLYIDADVFIRDGAPVPELGSGFHAATDHLHAVHTQTWLEWCRTIGGTDLPESTVYHNAGVWLCDRDSARMILDRAHPPYIEALMEEYQWNLWLQCAIRDGMEFHRLDDKWNHSLRNRVISDTSWFVHVWGDDKLNDFNEI